MENISKMEMASALFSQIYIKTEHYSPTEGQKVKAILEATQSELYAVLKKEGRPETSANGNFRLNLCYSRDHEFAALHLQQFSGFEYHTIGEIRFAAGDEAKKLLSAFVK